MRNSLLILALGLLAGCATSQPPFTLYRGDKVIFVDVERAEAFRALYGIEPHSDGRIVMLRQEVEVRPAK